MSLKIIVERMLLALFGLIVALLVCELLLRILANPSWRELHFPPYISLPDTDRIYGMKPHFQENSSIQKLKIKISKNKTKRPRPPSNDETAIRCLLD